jgi:hypothetical protein
LGQPAHQYLVIELKFLKLLCITSFELGLVHGLLKIFYKLIADLKLALKFSNPLIFICSILSRLEVCLASLFICVCYKWQF